MRYSWQTELCVYVCVLNESIDLRIATSCHHIVKLLYVFFLFIYFSNAGDQTKALMQIRQALYH